MPYYFAWLRNTTDIRDDEPVKIKASSMVAARNIAGQHLRGRFLIRDVYTRKQFKKLYPWWHSIMWGQKARNE